MMAPAIIGEGIPSVCPIPNNAIPTVPAVVQEEPVATDTIEQIHKVATKKIPGDKMLSPQ